MTHRQLPYHIADCGARCPVRQLTPYEFAWTCTCGEAGTISWTHADPPPQFEPNVPQPTLFQEEES